MEFVVVRNVVEEVERKILLKFGDHRRSPENGCRPPPPAEPPPAPPPRKYFWWRKM